MSVKKVIAGCCIAGAAILCAGMETENDSRNAILVEETYIVKPGDTLWGILEYKEGIYENNPWLVDRKGLIRPGDELQMTYWVKGGSNDKGTGECACG